MDYLSTETCDAFRPGAKVAVMGAGPAGLAAARRLLEAGLDVTVFERKSEAGGTWIFQEDKCTKSVIPTQLSSNITANEEAKLAEQVYPSIKTFAGESLAAAREKYAPSSACYESLTNNIAVPLMQFHGFQYPAEMNWFVSHRDILKYLQKVSRDSGVDAVTRYNTSVARVRKGHDGKWNVLTRRLEWKGKEKLQAIYEESTFDLMAVNTGHYEKPFVPTIPGLNDWVEKWPGTILHSKQYLNNKPFENENVLIIGAGSSAFDIGRDIAFVAKTVYQSVREKKSDGRSAAETIFERTTRSVLPENVIKVSSIASFEYPMESTKMNEARIHLKDSTVLIGIDRVIFCTGYRFTLPFLDDYAATSVSDYQAVGGKLPIITDGIQLHNLHEDIFYIPDPTLAFIGVKFEVSTFPLFDCQAILLASVFSGRTKLPSTQTMQNAYQQRLIELGPGKPFHVLGWKKERVYMQKIADMIDEDDVCQIVQGYDCVLSDTRARQLEAFRGFLTRTTKFRGKTREEVAEIITLKATGIEMELARMDRLVQSSSVVV